MKFAEHLGAHITPEWRKQYIQYEIMKSMLYEAQEEAPSPEVTDPSSIQRFFARFDERFFQFCDKELAKINTFFSEKFAEASRKFATLSAELQDYSQLQQKQPGLRHRKTNMYNLFRDKEQKVVAHTRKLHDLKLAFSEFYLSLILLQNYQTLNFTGFRKILKKHDKLMNTSRGVQWRQSKVETAHFYTTKDVDHLIKETEQIVTSDLEGGNRQKAMKRLRVPPLGDQQNPWTTFRVGLFAGIFGVLVIVIILAAQFTEQSEVWEPALRMYRGTFLLILDFFLLGINTYGWRSSGVNHVLIFELDPRNHLSHQKIFEMAAFLAVVWAISVLCFLFSTFMNIPVFANPLSLVVFLIVYLINPMKILHHKARRWLLRVLFRIFTAPFHHVGFADFWLADQLNSLVMVFLDFEYMVCFYSLELDWNAHLQTLSVCTKSKYGIRAIVSCLPAWFRFAQCLRRYRDTRLKFPHIVNAGKYSTTFFVVIFSTLYNVEIENNEDAKQNSVFFYLWIVAAIFSSCYTLTWDLKMDWGLFDENAGENRLLREEIVYAYKGYYYFAIIEDFILRFIWILNVTIVEAQMIKGEIATTILSSLEVFRRFVWNFYRLENEHLNNCGQFRAVRDISIAPIESNDQALIEEMMDDPDGMSQKQSEQMKLIAKSKRDNTKVWIDDDEQENSMLLKFKGL